MAVVNLKDVCTPEELEKVRYICREMNAQKVWVIDHEKSKEQK